MNAEPNVSRAMGRIILITGAALVSLALLALLPATRSLGADRSIPTGWQDLLNESFDAGIGAGWIVTDTSTTDGGEYTWGTTTFTYTSPITAVWAVGGGADGSNLDAATDTYPDNVDSWLIYGPLDLSEVFHAEGHFSFWVDLNDGDRFEWCVMTDISDLSEPCSGTSVSGRVNAWITGILSLDGYARTDTPIYLAFHFTSDGDGNTGRGVFVDDVVVRGDYGSHVFLPLIRHDPTPTPSAYVDNFDNPSSGWYVGPAYRRNNNPLPGCLGGKEKVAEMSYLDGHYRMYVFMDCRGGGNVDTWFVWPAQEAPLGEATATDYTVEARGVFANAGPYEPWWAHWGVVFAANSDFTDLYTLQVNANGSFAVLRYPTYNYPGNRSTDNETPIIWWIDTPIVKLNPNYNTLRVEVRGDRATFYINDTWVGSETITGLSSMTKVGLIGGSWEVTPVDVRVDYFSYQEP